MNPKLIMTTFAATALGLGSTALADTAPDTVKVKSIAYAGSGCPAGSVAENIAPDMQALTLLFDEYIAETGFGAPLSESRKNCQINIELEFPQGWSYSLATLDYRGYAMLDPGVTGTQKADYYFQGETGSASFATEFHGFFDQDYSIRDTLALDALVWSPCGATKAVNINTQVKVAGGDDWSGGLMTIDSIDGKIAQQYGLKWKRCDGGTPDDPTRPPPTDDDDDGRPGDVTGPANVTINSIQHAGSGCPAGTVAENVAADGQAFTLLFDSFIAEAGPGISVRENRKNCQLLIDLDYDAGWTYALASFDYRGYVSLDPRVEATQKSTYYFQGSRDQVDFDTDFVGALDQDYHARDVLALDALIWAPCGARRALNINSQVRLNNRRNRRGYGVVTLDSIDGMVHHTYGLVWRRCR